MKQTLLSGGAKQDYYMSEMISHVVADDHTLSEVGEAQDLFQLTIVSVSSFCLTLLLRS